MILVVKTGVQGMLVSSRGQEGAKHSTKHSPPRMKSHPAPNISSVNLEKLYTELTVAE